MGKVLVGNTFPCDIILISVDTVPTCEEVAAVVREKVEKQIRSSFSRAAPLSSKNVVIGANQYEGIHCKGTCNIQNVWFEDVCEDAITLKGTSGTVNIQGGGARGASDKVIQHNGGGTVNIDSYCIQTFGKLYRSCGNCKTQYQRVSKVNLSNIITTTGAWSIVGINSNYGDVATFTTSSIQATSVRSWCDTYKGNNSGAEPILLTTNQKNAYCKF
ncbi:hypothetical protein FRC03_003853 [Tulasnella sp. 419]|nr:hypothetical protein FRC03_003853 [Tulasnella sp. 419]